MFDDGQAKASSRQKDSDSYLCPAGEILKPRKVKKTRASIDYAVTKKVCDACVIRSECTKSKTGRTIKRHITDTKEQGGEDCGGYRLRST